jgi:hypothetical protein
MKKETETEIKECIGGGFMLFILLFASFFIGHLIRNIVCVDKKSECPKTEIASSSVDICPNLTEVQQSVEENNKVLKEIVRQRQKLLCEKNEGEISVYLFSYDFEEYVYCNIGKDSYEWKDGSFRKSDYLK